MGWEQRIFYHMAVALAIGLLIGVERGWREREAKEGARIAGVRTYGLIGLLGGVSALLSEKLGALVLGLAFVGLAGVLVAVYVVNLQRREDVGITSLVAGLLTFVFGALAMQGEVVVASSAAVITVLLLDYKPLLHRWVGALESVELRAGIKLLLISVVLLPILPDRGYGPWQTLNPYAIWWMVVLIALISFLGYFAVKIVGARKGLLSTGLFGGLASSTAVTLHFSRLAQRERAMIPVLGTGILLACGTMFPRMLLVACLVNRDMFLPLLPPVIIMSVVVYTPVLFYWWRLDQREIAEDAPLRNPLELRTAITFGTFLAVVMLLGRALQTWFGKLGVMALAAASGLADVDAITLSLARMSQHDLTLVIAVTGVVIAAAVNSLVKGSMALLIGGRDLGLHVGLPLLASVAGGLLSIWLFLF